MRRERQVLCGRNSNMVSIPVRNPRNRWSGAAMTTTPSSPSAVSSLPAPLIRQDLIDIGREAFQNRYGGDNHEGALIAAIEAALDAREQETENLRIAERIDATPPASAQVTDAEIDAEYTAYLADRRAKEAALATQPPSPQSHASLMAALHSVRNTLEGLEMWPAFVVQTHALRAYKIADDAINKYTAALDAAQQQGDKI
jgi:hypothetical protein